MKTAKTRIWVTPVVLFLLLALAVPATSAQLAQYTFSISTGASSDLDTGSVAGDITKGAGIQPNRFGFDGTGNPDFGLFIDSRATGDTFDANDYFGFTVTPVGQNLNLSGSSITFQSLAANLTLNWDLRSSVDTYASSLASGSQVAGGTWADNSYTFSGAGFNNLSSITLRIYVWDDQHDDNALDRFDNITLVPEPYEFGLIGVIGLIGFAVRERFMRKAA